MRSASQFPSIYDKNYFSRKIIFLNFIFRKSINWINYVFDEKTLIINDLYNQ
jgi:hypothetical protein